MQTKNIKFATTFLLLLVIVSCSGPGLLKSSGPSEGDAKTAVENVVTAIISAPSYDYPPLSKGEVKFSSFLIVRRGEYSETGKYYPLQVQQEGSFVENSWGGRKTCNFVGKADFRMSKNDYGEWSAQVVAVDQLNRDFKLTCN